MSTTTPTSGPPEQISSAANGSPLELTPVLSPKFALGLPHLCLVVLVSLLFMLLNYVGLRPTDLWCHVAYGNWILTNETLPTEDPFMPLSVGVEVTNNAWLAQILLAKLYGLGGPELLSTTFAATLLISLVILTRVYYVQSGRVSLATLGLVLTVIIGWSRLLTIRPEMLGLLAFCILLWLTTRLTLIDGHRSRWPRFVWCLVPLVFALWANLHGSFACGLALLGCHLLGTTWEIGWRERSVYAVWRSRTIRRWLILCELALFACLLNPHGMDLLINTFLFSGNENLRDVLEWQSLALGGVGGLEFVLSIVLLVIVFRHSRRRVQATEVILLALFTAAAVAGVRMISWYAPVVVFVLMPHITEIASRLVSRNLLETPESQDDTSRQTLGFRLPRGRSFTMTLGCGLMIWIAFAMSPVSQFLLGGPARNPDQVYGDQTPLGVTQYLREHPPEGQIWNPQYWGDWIVTDGPADVPVFSTTMIHLMPRQVWQDYSRVYYAGHGWRRVLDRYVVDTIVIDKRRQETLAGAIRHAEDWSLVYEDDQALIANRQDEEGQVDPPARLVNSRLATHSSEGRITDVGVKKP